MKKLKYEPLDSPLTVEMFNDFISKMIVKTTEGRKRKFKFMGGLGFVKNVHEGCGSDLDFLVVMQESFCGGSPDAWEYIFDVAIKTWPSMEKKFYIGLFQNLEIYLTEEAIEKFGWK